MIVTAAIANSMGAQELGDPFRHDALKTPVRLVETYRHTNVG